ncbi:MAG: helix-turn-helix domain-containing protein, partial [Oscillospiraceae bacterium]|nr:helix-turn-helix domain-containing protein [Oscillospiraceae bacterium]
GDKVGDNLGDNTTSLWDHRKSAIVDLLIEEPKLSIDAISSRLNLTRRQVERSINMLKEEQRLFRDGSARSGHWVVRS